MVFPSSPAKEQRTLGFACKVTLHHLNFYRFIRALTLLESPRSWWDKHTLGPCSRPAEAETAFYQAPQAILGHVRVWEAVLTLRLGVKKEEAGKVTIIPLPLTCAYSVLGRGPGWFHLQAYGNSERKHYHPHSTDGKVDPQKSSIISQRSLFNNDRDKILTQVSLIPKPVSCPLSLWVRFRMLWW